jgi:FixJ family two-component response regulator
MQGSIHEKGTPVVVGVDDDFRLRESLQRLVESAGYTAFLYSSAEELLESEEVAAAHCLITDVRMTGMDGLELQRRVNLLRPKLPIIFISAHYDEEIRQRALHGGARAFLYKPFDAVELLSLVRRALDEFTDT